MRGGRPGHDPREHHDRRDDREEDDCQPGERELGRGRGRGKHLHRSGKALLSPDAWKIRFLFWFGAVLVGLVASGFAIVTEHANAGFNRLIEISPYLPFLVCPLGLLVVSWLTVKFFPGSQGSGIPQSIAALQPCPAAVTA